MRFPMDIIYPPVMGDFHHVFDHGADFIRVVSHQNAVVPLAGEETVLVFAGNGLVVRERLAYDAPCAAREDVVRCSQCGTRFGAIPINAM